MSLSHLSLHITIYFRSPLNFAIFTNMLLSNDHVEDLLAVCFCGRVQGGVVMHVVSKNICGCVT
jgi:hypothetical protein